MINAICDNLLLTAFALEKREATVAMLDEVSRDMRLEWPGSRNRGQQSRYRDSPASTPARAETGLSWER
jgi:hypothetical protein